MAPARGGGFSVRVGHGGAPVSSSDSTSTLLTHRGWRGFDCHGTNVNCGFRGPIPHTFYTNGTATFRIGVRPADRTVNNAPSFGGSIVYQAPNNVAGQVGNADITIEDVVGTVVVDGDAGAGAPGTQTTAQVNRASTFVLTDPDYRTNVPSIGGIVPLTGIVDGNAGEIGITGVLWYVCTSSQEAQLGGGVPTGCSQAYPDNNDDRDRVLSFTPAAAHLARGGFLRVAVSYNNAG